MSEKTESTAIAASSRDHVGSLGKGLAVMEVLAANPAGLTLTEMADKAGLTRAGARRFLLTLTATGYATQNGRRFQLSARLLTVARTWLQGTPLWTFAEPIMRELSAAFNESCSAAILGGEDVVYVARAPSRAILSVTLHVGTRLPAYCTSMGKILLSSLEEVELEAFLKKAVLTPNTPKTITDPSALRDAIDKVRRDGFAIADEELELGLRSIAVPIRDGRGRIVAALNISTQTARMSVAEMKRDILPALRESAARIESYFLVQ
ncbi:MAG TPA: IclR family transcriptional regulator C-terminal domain-containing protein [Rhizobiaceae bacterium]|nr:IclR family transcriptional regulator C-terminal domain-containing protein [Rhizobiaceae bacterium]